MEEKINNVLNYWKDNMPMMAMEELAECAKAISKCERNRGAKKPKCYEELKKEIADVYISLKAIMLYYAITDDDIKDKVKEKLEKKYDRYF